MMLTLHDPQKTREHYASGAWQHDTMYGLLAKHAAQRPSAVALRDNFTTLTWREVFQAVEALAATLHNTGLQAGDRVAIWLPSRVESVMILLACSRNGYVCCPSMHQSYTADEIITLLKRVDCKAFFTTPGYGSDAAKHPVFEKLGDVKSLRATFVCGAHFAQAASPIVGTVPYPKEAANVGSQPAPVENPDKIVYLAFTSGTTGLPKGVMHSDNTLLANGRSMVKDWHHNTDTILLTLSPLSHHIGTVAAEQWLSAGMQLAIHNYASGIPAIEWIIDYVRPEIHPLAKRIKDMASAAVFLSYINCIVVWVIMLWPDNTVWRRIGAMLSGH